MAANDAEEAGDVAAWDGLVLLASYPTEEISTPVLSIYGTEDKVLNTGKYKKTKAAGLWPADFTEVIIKGGNHAQFGNYGEQKGDGSPAITAAEQQKETADAISEWADASNNNDESPLENPIQQCISGGNYYGKCCRGEYSCQHP